MVSPQQVLQALEKADAAGNVEDARELTQLYQQIQGSQQGGPDLLPAVPGFFEGIADAFTGASRTTPRTEETPELEMSDLLADESIADNAKIAALSLVTPDPGEMAKILQSNFPHIKIEGDEHGTLFAVNTKTGADAVLNRPGFSYSDFVSLIGTGLAFTPAGRGLGAATRAGRIGQVAGRSALTQTAIEEAQQAAGGEFNPEDIAIEGALGTAGQGVGEGIGALLGARGRQLTGRAETARGEAELAEAQRIGQPLSPELQAQQQTRVLSDIAGAIKESPTGVARPEAPRLRELAAQPDIDPEALAAAQRLGVAEELIPSQLARNQEYIEIEQGLASVIGSQLNAQQVNAARKVAEKADDLITEFGGVTDKAALSDQIRDTVLGNIKQLDDQADIFYNQVNDLVPPETIVDTTNLQRVLDERISNLGGEKNLQPFEKDLLDLIDDPPTYALLDEKRQTIGAAFNKKEGPYKDALSGRLKFIYGPLLDDQQAAAEAAGAGDLFAMGRAVVKQRKTLEDNSIVLLGREKAGAVMPKVGAAIKKISGGDYKDFDKIMEALPPDTRQIAVLSAMNDAFTKGTRQQDQFSAPAFAKWYRTLSRNQAAFKRVMKHVPKEAQMKLKDLATLAESMRRASGERVMTGRVRTLLDDFQAEGGFVDRLYGNNKDAIKTGFVAEAVGQVAGLPGAGTIGGVVKAMSRPVDDPLSVSASKLLADPEFQKLAKQMATAKVDSDVALQRAADAVTRSKNYQEWLNALPSASFKQAIRLGVVGFFTAPLVEGSGAQPLELTVTPEDARRAQQGQR